MSRFSLPWTGQGLRTLALAALVATPATGQPPVLTLGPLVTNAVLSTSNNFVVATESDAVFRAAATDADGDEIEFLWDFGDGETDEGELVEHSYSECGVYNASLTITDGVSSNVAPLTVTVPCDGTLTIAKMAVKLLFNKSNADSISLTGDVLLYPEFTPAGQQVNVDIGGATVDFLLDAKGKGVGPIGSIQLKAGKVLHHWSVKLALKKGDFREELDDDGLVNGTVAPEEVTLEVLFIIGGQSFTAERNLTYKASEDKSGSAK